MLRMKIHLQSKTLLPVILILFVRCEVCCFQELNSLYEEKLGIMQCQHRHIYIRHSFVVRVCLSALSSVIAICVLPINSGKIVFAILSYRSSVEV